MPIKAIILVGHGRDCPYCGRTMSVKGKADDPDFPTRDHIKSRYQGGGHRIIVCRKCNLDKSWTSITSWCEKLEKAGDERAPVVAAFIASMATGAHLRIMADYERRANQAGMRDKVNGRKSLVARARRAAKKACKRRAKCDANRGEDGANEKSGDRVLSPQEDRTRQADQYAAYEGREEATEDQRHGSSK